MNKLDSVTVGDSNPVRIMGILNTSPESFLKTSIKQGYQHIKNTVKQMEQEGVDIIDVGGMSTAPYLKTMIPERIETNRITNAIKIIQNISNLPISIDTCRASVAKSAFDLGVNILNDISGLQYDSKMTHVVCKYKPSVILGAFSRSVIRGEQITKTKNLLKQSIVLAKKSGILSDNIVIDPSIGFFRRSGNGRFFTKIDSDWFARDLKIIQNLDKLKQNYPMLISVSNKSFIGKLLDIANPLDRITGSVTVEAMCVLNGANIIRTHNVKQTIQAVNITEKILKLYKGL